MSDIFREVDEEVRREQLKRLWDSYGHYIVALLVLIVLGVAGWRGYEWWQGRKAAEFGARFEAAMQLANEGKSSEAEAAFASIAAEGTSGYRTLARFRAAAVRAQQDHKGAVEAYDALASDSSLAQPLRDLAAVRSGFLLVDSSSYADMTKRLEPLTAAGRPFRHTARQLLALSAWHAGDLTAARHWFDIIMTDAETPASIRSQIQVLMALVAAKGQS